ncbi:MAG: carboxypeptidase M32 [Bdellovibrionales bacterium]|nr:carboxypeptidase M32 [Bdellovibrionales bacterium]
MANDTFALERFREISHLDSILNLLQWDMETFMPRGSSELRGRQLATLSALKHARETDPAYVESAFALPDSPVSRALKRSLLRNLCVDPKFVAALSEAQVRCQDLWKTARATNDFPKVMPALDELVQLQREWAARYAAHPQSPKELATLTPFEIHFDYYEPGLRLARLDALFAELGPALSERVPAILARQKQRGALTGNVQMPIAEQRTLVRTIAEKVGFNFERGRLDESTHPFCGGSPEDTRMTVRYLESDFTSAVLGATHESGHSIYEQNLPPDLLHTPVGTAASFGVHESQSRFLENQIGRSRAFTEYLAQISHRPAEGLYAHLNRVNPSLIRVEADEVTYNLHILVRVAIEKDLLNGKMTTRDLPEAWNAGYKRLLGIEVPNAGKGCLQDIHWFGGAFGYFATYTLGNLLAAALFQDFQAENPQWESQIAHGDFAAVRTFCKDRVHRHAAQHNSPDTMRLALKGRELSAQPFLQYVDAKFLSH